MIKLIVSSLVFTSCVCLSASAYKSSPLVAVAQTPVNQKQFSTQEIVSTEPTSQEANRAAAERAEAEAKQLGKDAPLTQQIAKREEALKYWRAAKDPKKEAKSLQIIALYYSLRGEYRKALDYSQQSLSISKTLNDRDGKGLAVGSIGMIYEALGEYQKAIDNNEQSIQLFPNTPELSPSVFTSIGNIYLKLGENQKAIEYYQKAGDFWKEKGNVIKQANNLDYIAGFYARLGDIQKSIDTFKQANTLAPVSKRSLANIAYLSIAGAACEDKLAALGNVPIEQPPGSSSAESSDQNSNLSGQQRVEKYRRLESIKGEAEALESLAWSEYEIKGEYEKALKAYQQALRLRQTTGAPLEEASTLTDIADVLNNQGKKQEAINHYNQALDIQRRINARPDVADTLSKLGNVYQTLGAYDLSLRTYNEALSLFQSMGNRLDETMTFLDIGFVYRQLKDPSKAIKSYQQALTISQTTGDCHNETKSLVNLSKAYADAADYPQAIESGNKAVNLARNLDTIEYKLLLQAGGLNSIARVSLKQGNYQKALLSAQQALKLSRETNGYFREVEANALGVNAEIYSALKQPEKAIQSYQEQLAIYRTLSWQPEQALSLYNLAQIESKQGNTKQALTQIEAAIKIIENIRSQVASPEVRTDYFATVQDYYQFYIDLLMQLHKKDPSKGYNALALHISERSRARSLLELLTEARADIRQGVEPQLLAEERSLQQQIDARKESLVKLRSSQYKPEQIETLNKEIAKLSDKYKQVQANIRARSPRYAALTQPQPLTLEEIQSSVLDDNTILLEYSLGKERSYLWLVTKTGIKSYELPKGEDIEATAKQFYQNLAQNKLGARGGLNVVPVDNSENSAKIATKLSEILLRPVVGELESKRLVIVGDGILQYIPFATLPNPQQSQFQPLLVEHEIVNLPSVSSIDVVRDGIKNRQPAAKKIAIFADPVFDRTDERVKKSIARGSQTTDTNSTYTDLNSLALKRSSLDLGLNFHFDRLDGTRTEAEKILSLVPESSRKSTFDFAANRTTINSPELSQYQIIHLATHGIFNTNHPELSGVVLSLVDRSGNPQDGFLELEDIFNLNLPAELVVLSACQTGLGEEVKGEGLVGLTRGFMYAGSPRVVVSLWSVDDKATSELMAKFYTKMLKDNLKPAAALRAAQLEMWQNSNYAAPYFWAAFTLQGEWR